MPDPRSAGAARSIAVGRGACSYPAVSVGLLATAGVAWWLTVERMVGMDAGPGAGLGTLGWFAVSWLLMMAAMMLPSYGPALRGYATLARTRRSDRLLVFAAGYLLAWVGVGLVAYGLFELGTSLLGSELAWTRGGRWLSGGVVALAAGYELLPLKRRCLARCRGQDTEQDAGSQRASRRRPGVLRAGARSGASCIGCSWALMATLFALGVMSLTWMALVAALVTLQKVGPSPLAARIATAILLTALAAGVLLVPHDVPGLVLTGAMHSMASPMHAGATSMHPVSSSMHVMARSILPLAMIGG
jgi:predicted metal-binding membrane protein